MAPYPWHSGIRIGCAALCGVTRKGSAFFGFACRSHLQLPAPPHGQWAPSVVTWTGCAVHSGPVCRSAVTLRDRGILPGLIESGAADGTSCCAIGAYATRSARCEQLAEANPRPVCLPRPKSLLSVSAQETGVSVFQSVPDRGIATDLTVRAPLRIDP